MENNVETAAKAKTEKKVFFTEERLEMFIAIFLGVTALLTAWATWIGSLHGGNQATNYTTSNNIAAEGNSMWNEASQQYMQDLMVWNSIVDYQTELEIAEKEGDDEKYRKKPVYFVPGYDFRELVYGNIQTCNGCISLGLGILRTLCTYQFFRYHERSCGYSCKFHQRSSDGTFQREG